MGPHSVSREDLAELFDGLDSSIIQRITETGATAEEVGAALDDLDHERRYCERRVPASAKIAELRAILEDAASESGGGGARVISIHGDLIVR
ncbi:MAG TPA: hypothetical protein VN253_01975 [Kofleriaceae bacterium]|nr:hypothetical protein [Kofleriaceae bacterium]